MTTTTITDLHTRRVAHLPYRHTFRRIVITGRGILIRVYHQGQP